MSFGIAAKLLERGTKLILRVGVNRNIDHGILTLLPPFVDLCAGAVGFWRLRF
jgi:hypothetical protein